MDRRIVIAAVAVAGFAAGWFLRAGVHGAIAPVEAEAAPVEPADPAAPPGKPMKQAFEDIYKNSLWGESQATGKSGTGSTMRATMYWRIFLTEFLKANHITSVVDAGCGDWEFSQSVDWTGIDYKGYDIVAAVIDADKKRFEAPNIHFFAGDMIETDLPPADLLISKHVLQHLPTAAVQKFMTQFGKYRHVLLVDGVNPLTLSSGNPDITAGNYRHLDVTAPPFNLRGAKVLTYWDGINMHQVVHTVGHR